jgi:arachidonate 15-lipoxygenase
VPSDIRTSLGGASLENEVAAGRIFLVDHRDPLTPVTTNGEWKFDGKTFNKYLPKTAGLFWWNRFTQRLVPVALQAAGYFDTPVSPHTGNGSEWVEAKLAFQAADGVVHEMSSHLGRTHLAMEGIAVSAHRQLDERHPVLRLLLPHFRFMLSLNDKAGKSLIAKESNIDMTFGAPISQVVGVAKLALETWDFTRHAFPNDIKNRGVGRDSGLPAYAFRDDGELLWKAIHDYAGEFVEIYYSNDRAVADDSELRAWAVEVSAQGSGAHVKGFPPLETREQLTFALTQTVFVCSALHSAVNYGQADYLLYSPNSPLATWERPGSDKGLFALLPPFGAAKGQIATLAQLTSFRYDQLGDYENDYTDDHRANLVIRSFAQRLDEIETEVRGRNQTRWQKYEYLRPSLVLNSISI